MSHQTWPLKLVLLLISATTTTITITVATIGTCCRQAVWS